MVDPVTIRSFSVTPFNSEQKMKDFVSQGSTLLRAFHAYVDKHSQGQDHYITLTHSDLTPQNILVDNQNDIILYFGLGKGWMEARAVRILENHVDRPIR